MYVVFGYFSVLCSVQDIRFGRPENPGREHNTAAGRLLPRYRHAANTPLPSLTNTPLSFLTNTPLVLPSLTNTPLEL